MDCHRQVRHEWSHQFGNIGLVSAREYGGAEMCSVDREKGMGSSVCLIWGAGLMGLLLL